MFNMGTPEILVVVAVIIFFVGPKGIPKLARDIKQGVKVLRDYAAELTSSFDDVVKDTEFKDAADMFREVRSFNPRSQLNKILDSDDDLSDTFKEFDVDLNEGSGSSKKSSSPIKEEKTSTAGQNPLLDEANDHLDKLSD